MDEKKSGNDLFPARLDGETMSEFYRRVFGVKIPGGLTPSGLSDECQCDKTPRCPCCGKKLPFGTSWQYNYGPSL